MKNCKRKRSEDSSLKIHDDDDDDDDDDDKMKELSTIVKNQSLNHFHKRKKQEKIKEDPEEKYGITVEKYMAIFEVAFEDDVVLNRESKPCINKLQKLPLLVQALTNTYLHKVFINHGVFTLLKNWLEPLPDGSLPNFNIRQGILMLLTLQFQFDVNQWFIKEQLRVSGLGKAIMFLSQSDEETASNRKLARELVYRWSRSIYNISTRMEDARSKHAEPMPKKPCFRPMITKPAPTATKDDFYDFSSGHRKIAKSNITSRAQIPEASSMAYIIAPQSKIVKKNEEDRRCDNILRKLRQLRARERNTTPPGLRLRLTT